MSSPQDPSSPSSWPPPDPHRGAPLGARFFDLLRSKPLRRPVQHPVSGVCSAFADRYGLDRDLVRVVFVVLVVAFSGVAPVLVAGYGLAWLLIPDERDTILAENALRGRWSTGVVVALLLTVTGVSAAGSWSGSDWAWFDGGTWIGVLVLLLAAAAVTIVLAGRGRRPQTPRPPDTVAGPGPQGPADPATAPLHRPPPPAAPAGPDPLALAPAQPAHAVDLRKPPVRALHPAPAAVPHQAPAPATRPALPDAATSAHRAAPGEPGPSADPGTGDPEPPSGWTPSGAGTGPGRPSRRPGPGPRVVSLVTGLVLVAVAAGLAAGSVTDGFPVVLTTSLAALVIVAVAVLVTGLRGRRAGGLTSLAIPAVLVVGVSAGLSGTEQSFSVDLTWPTSATWTPTGTADREYSMGTGARRLDLTWLQPPHQGQAPPLMQIDAGYGQVEVVVPPGTSVDLDLVVGLGNIDLGPFEGRPADAGGGARIQRTVGEGPQLAQVQVHLDAGQISVLEE